MTIEAKRVFTEEDAVDQKPTDILKALKHVENAGSESRGSDETDATIKIKNITSYLSHNLSKGEQKAIVGLLTTFIPANKPIRVGNNIDRRGLLDSFSTIGQSLNDALGSNHEPAKAIETIARRHNLNGEAVIHDMVTMRKFLGNLALKQ